MPSRELGHNLQGAPRVRYLNELKATCNYTKAAECIDLSVAWLKEIRKRDSEFEAACENAIAEGIDLLEHEVVRRGFRGIDKPVYWQGIRIDTVKEYSDTLAKFVLESYRPEKFRESKSLNVNHTGGVLLIPASMSLEDWAKQNNTVIEKPDVIDI